MWSVPISLNQPDYGMCDTPHEYVYGGLKYSTGNADLSRLFISHTQFGSFRNCADSALYTAIAQLQKAIGVYRVG